MHACMQHRLTLAHAAQLLAEETLPAQHLDSQGTLRGYQGQEGRNGVELAAGSM